MVANEERINFNGKERLLQYFLDGEGRRSYWVHDIEFGGDSSKYRSSGLNIKSFVSSIETDTFKHSGDVDEKYGEIGFNDSALIGEKAAREARERKTSTICVTVSRFYPKVGLDFMPENFENLTKDERTGYTAELLQRVLKEVENPDNFT